MLKEINYKIFFDNKWYYILTIDCQGMSKKQVSEIKALTDIISKLVDALNRYEQEDDKKFMGGIFDAGDMSKQKK